MGRDIKIRPMRSRLAAFVALALCLPFSAWAQNQLSPDQEQTLTEALSKPEMKVRVQAALILGNAGSARAVPALVTCTRDEDYRVRGACALALGRLNDLRGIDPLVHLLDDHEQFVREEAVRSLKLMARAEAVPYMRSAREQISPRAREFLVEIAQSMTDAAGADALLTDLLADEAVNVRAALDTVIAGLDPKRAQSLLVAGLDHPNYRVRARSAALLGDRGVAEVTKLSALLAKPAEVPEVHAAARNALRKLAAVIDGAALAATVKDPNRSDSERAEALMVLAAKGGDPSYRVCLAALGDGSEFIRGTAATALADLGDARAVEPLRVAAAEARNSRIAGIVQGSIRQLEGNARARP